MGTASAMPMSGTISGATSMAPITTAVDSTTTPNDAITEANPIRAAKRAYRTGAEGPSKYTLSWSVARSSLAEVRRDTQARTASPTGSDRLTPSPSTWTENTWMKPAAASPAAVSEVAATTMLSGNTTSRPPPTSAATVRVTCQGVPRRARTIRADHTAAAPSSAAPTSWVDVRSESSGCTSSAADRPAPRPTERIVQKVRRWW